MNWIERWNDVNVAKTEKINQFSLHVSGNNWKMNYELFTPWWIQSLKLWRGTVELLSSHSIPSDSHVKFVESVNSETLLKPNLRLFRIDSNVSCSFLEFHAGGATGHLRQTKQLMWIDHTQTANELFIFLAYVTKHCKHCKMTNLAYSDTENGWKTMKRM